MSDEQDCITLIRTSCIDHDLVQGQFKYIISGQDRTLKAEEQVKPAETNDQRDQSPSQ